jgi:hypothetical protein
MSGSDNAISGGKVRRPPESRLAATAVRTIRPAIGRMRTVKRSLKVRFHDAIVFVIVSEFVMPGWPQHTHHAAAAAVAIGSAKPVGRPKLVHRRAASTVG